MGPSNNLQPTVFRSLAIAVGLASFILVSAALAAQSSRESKGWVPLFNGKTMDHWNDPRKMTPPGDSWTVQDGALKTISHPRITEDLVSTQAYGNFELAWEWKIAEGGNSGVKYRVQSFPILTASSRDRNPAKFEDQVDNALRQKSVDRSIIGPSDKAQIYVIGFEYQMIDNARHADAKHGSLYQTGALYGIVPPSKNAATNSAGQWNRSRLVVDGNHFQHWLNGKKVVDVDAAPALLENALLKRWSPGSETLRQLTAQPKKQCPITLQNHGDVAWFRNIKIHELP